MGPPLHKKWGSFTEYKKYNDNYAVIVYVVLLERINKGYLALSVKVMKNNA